MKRSEQLVEQIYQDNPALWRHLWREFCIERLAFVARSYIHSLHPLDIAEKFDLLDHPAERCALVDSSAAIDPTVNALANPGEFRELVKTASASAGVGVPKMHQIQKILRPLVAQTLNTVESNHILASIAPNDIYVGLADRLSSELFDLGDSGGDADERLVLNYCLLAFCLRRWRIPCSQFRRTLQPLCQGRMGLCGSLISLNNRFFETANCDEFAIPVCPWPAMVALDAGVVKSDVLLSVQHEAVAVPTGHGFFHKAIDVANPVNAPLKAANPHVSETMVRSLRDLAYCQYEYTAIVFMTLVGIECIIRSHCSSLSSADETTIALLDKSGYISDDLRHRLLRVFDTEDWNVRNRTVHGSFLEIEGRRVELTMHSGICRHLGVQDLDLSQDGSLLSNVAAVLLRLLSDLAASAAKGGNVPSLSWAEHFLLTEDEIAFGEHVHCDFLDSVATGEAWRREIADYLRDVTPCLSIPLQEGLRSWFSPTSGITTLPGFSYLMLLFEPFLRLTLHLAGRPVIQRGMSTRGGRRHYRVQYSMLDSDGLISDGNIAWLVSHLTLPERAVAERTLRLAVKCRDAFAHGAVTQYTDSVRTVYGHLVVKAIQLVVNAGRNHLEGMGSSHR